MKQPSFLSCAALAVVTFCAAAAAAQTADQTGAAVAFPETTQSYLKTGAFIGPDHVARVRPTLGKDQVRLELGNPHFSEGFFNVREWDYVFNFYTGTANEFMTCQYKVRFDSDERVVSTHWKNPACQSLLTPPKAVAIVQPVPVVTSVAQPQQAPQQRRKITLSADGLFAFGKSTLKDTTPDSLQRLQQLASQLRSGDSRVVQASVIGHTDRIGSASANVELSQARAESIKNFLVSAGAPAQSITASGVGAAKPLVSCDKPMARPALIACLQPNRRVEVEMTVE